MKKISGFIVDKRYWVMGLVLLLAIACAFMIPHVRVNTDMTEYLPDNSEMRQGMDIMEAEFPGTEIQQTLRVMFKGLSESEKADIKAELEALPNVDSVAYEAGSADYNSGEYTLYVISTPFDYASSEYLTIQSTVERNYSDYELSVVSDSTQGTLPLSVVIIALVFLLLILFAMCSSWFEPVVFLAVIGTAILINLGTNLLFGSVSSTTFSIAAILQLVLSMDYSIILMNRYRQERALCPDKLTAMKSAMVNAFSAITSSALTTFVGLLMLVFMSFKIGMDLGLVLAKGVICSLFVIFTLLPCLILTFDNVIQKTAKKELHIPMGGLSRFSYRFRKVIAVGFVALFIGSIVLQGLTQTAYTIQPEDPIADVFAPTNTIVLLYDNKDEAAVASLADELESNPRIKTVLGSSTTLARPYTAQKMLDVIKEMGGSESFELDETMLSLLYYSYYHTGELPAIKAGELLSFIADEVLPNPTFSEYMGADLADNAELIKKFSNPDELTRPMNAAELASFFGMQAEQIEQLFVLYFSENGGGVTSRMSLGEFASFVKTDILANPDYAAMIPASVRPQIDRLVVFTNKDNVTQPITAAELAAMLGMGEDDVKLLYVYYFSNQLDFQPTGMTLPAFVDFIKNNVAQNPAFSSQFDPAALAQLNILAPFTDTTIINQPVDSAAMAVMLGLDATTIETLYSLYYGSNVDSINMTLPKFTGTLVSMMADPLLGAQFDDATKAQLSAMNAMMQAAVSGTSYAPAQMAALVGLDAALVSQLYVLYFNATNPNWDSAATMTINQFFTTLSGLLNDPAFSSQFDEVTTQSILQMSALSAAAVSGQELTAEQLSAVVGLPAESIAGMFQYASSPGPDVITSMKLPDFMDFLVSYIVPSQAFSGQFPPEAIAQLQQTKAIVDAAAADQPLNYTALASALGMDPGLVRSVFLLPASANQEMTLPQFTYFLVNTIINDPAFSKYFDSETTARLTGLNQMVSAAAGDALLGAPQLAAMLGLEQQTVQTILSLSAGSAIPSKAMSPKQFVDFLNTVVAANPAFSGVIDSQTAAQLTLLQTIMQLSLSDQALDSAAMASMMGMDAGMTKLLFTLRDSYGDTSDWKVSLQASVNFIVDNSSQFGPMLGGNLAELQTAQKMINGAVAGTKYGAGELASLLGMEQSQLNQLFLLYTSMHGNTSAWRVSAKNFVDFIVRDILPNASYSSQFNADTAKQLTTAQTLIGAVVSQKAYSAEELSKTLSPLSGDFDQSTAELLCLYYSSAKFGDSQAALSIKQLFDYLSTTVVDDPRFSSVIDSDMRTQIDDMSKQMDDAVSQMVGKNYSLLMLNTSLPAESEETTDFVRNLHEKCGSELKGDYYLIGNSPMNYEMEQSFDMEMLLITLLTAVAIFLVVAISFRSLAIPAILVLIVQCGVYITIAASGLMGYSIYYLALLIVQCILMGATIDYGILFTSYYRENRRTLPVREAIAQSYSGSIHTILTSGLIMILVTAIISIFSNDPTIAQICKTISLGALSATLLILFVLPSLLAVFDRVVTKKKDRAENREQTNAEPPSDPA